MNDKNYVLTDCPECGTEHRIHKGRIGNNLIKCKKCKCLFFVPKQISKPNGNGSGR